MTYRDNGEENGNYFVGCRRSSLQSLLDLTRASITEWTSALAVLDLGFGVSGFILKYLVVLQLAFNCYYHRWCDVFLLVNTTVVAFQRAG